MSADTTGATRHHEMIAPTGLELHWRMDLFCRSKRHPEFDPHGCLTGSGIELLLSVTGEAEAGSAEEQPAEE
jgi:hypothetical protein